MLSPFGLLPAVGAIGRDLDFTLWVPLDYLLIWQEQAQASGLELDDWVTMILDNALLRKQARRALYVDEDFSPKLREKFGDKPEWATWLSDRTTYVLLNEGWDEQVLREFFESDSGEAIPRRLQQWQVLELLLWDVVPPEAKPEDLVPPRDNF